MHNNPVVLVRAALDPATKVSAPRKEGNSHGLRSATERRRPAVDGDCARHQPARMGAVDEPAQRPRPGHLHDVLHRLRSLRRPHAAARIPHADRLAERGVLQDLRRQLHGRWPDSGSGRAAGGAQRTGAAAAGHQGAGHSGCEGNLAADAGRDQRLRVRRSPDALRARRRHPPGRSDHRVRADARAGQAGDAGDHVASPLRSHRGPPPGHRRGTHGDRAPRQRGHLPRDGIAIRRRTTRTSRRRTSGR